MQDLYSTDPTQETSARSCRFYRFHPATWARSYISGIYLPWLADLDQEVGIGGRFGVCLYIVSRGRKVSLTEGVFRRSPAIWIDLPVDEVTISVDEGTDQSVFSDKR